MKKVEADFDGPHAELAEAYKKWQAKQVETIEADRVWQH